MCTHKQQHTHTQSEHIGVNMFELIHEDDHADVRKKIEDSEMKSLNQKGV